jgi:Domain of unknown function (DUF3859)
MRGLLALMLLFVAAPDSQALTPRIRSINVTEYGIYTTNVTKTVTDAIGVPQHTVDDIKLAAATRTVPMQTGVQFGFRYVVNGAPAGAKVSLRVVTIYPPPGLLKSGSSTPIMRDEASWTKTIGKSTYNGYTLENPEELLPGNWVIEVWFGNQKLGSQSFTIVKQ